MTEFNQGDILCPMISGVPAGPIHLEVKGKNGELCIPYRRRILYN